jgi:hypothetical protein
LGEEAGLPSQNTSGLLFLGFTQQANRLPGGKFLPTNQKNWRKKLQTADRLKARNTGL